MRSADPWHTDRMPALPISLPSEIQVALSEVARAEHRSEREVLLDALRAYLTRSGSRSPVSAPAPRPTVPLLESGFGDPTAAERVEELLAGMGRLDC